MGIPSLLSCIEMVPISLFMAYSFPASPYLMRSSGGHEAGNGQHHPKSYLGGFLGVKAFIAMWNPYELISAISFALRIVGEGKSGRSNSAYQVVSDYHAAPRQYERYPAPQQYGLHDMSRR